MNKRSVGVRFHYVKSQDSDSIEPKTTIFDGLPLFSSHQLSPAASHFHSFPPLLPLPPIYIFLFPPSLPSLLFHRVISTH